MYQITKQQRDEIVRALGNMPINMAAELYNFFTNLKPVEEKKEEPKKEKK